MTEVECQNHRTWQIQLFIASNIALGVSLYFTLFYEDPLPSLLFLMVSLIILIVRTLSSLNHIKKHLEEEE